MSLENIKVMACDIDTEIRDTIDINGTEGKLFRIKDYIPKRSKRKFLKPCLGVGGIILFLIFIAIIIAKSSNRMSIIENGILDMNSQLKKIDEKFDNHYLERDVSQNNHNFKNINEKTIISNFSQKRICQNNNNFENIDKNTDSYFPQATTLQGIHKNEEIDEKSNNFFPQGVTLKDVLQVNKSSKNINKKLDSHLPQKIILYDDNSIYLFYPGTKEYNLLYRGESSISALITYNKGIIFSTEKKSTQIYYLPSDSLNATNNNLTLIFENARIKPYKMEIDSISENLYIIDKQMGALIIFNIQTKYYNLLLTDLKSPSDIVISCKDRLMFIVLADSISRSDMDGNKLLKIIENNGITAITINEVEKRVYWVYDFSNIESSSYDGKNRKLFLTEFFHIISLTMIEGQLFWLWPAHELSNATLLFSKTNDGTSNSKPYLYIIDFSENPKSIRYASFEKHNISNSFDHSCEHIGIQTSGNQFSCICNIGWHLHSAWRSCQRIIDFLLYSTANYIRGCILNIDKTNVFDVFLPVPYYTKTLQKKNGIHFDYDLKNDDFYFSDDRNLYRMKLKGNSSQTILFTVGEDTFINIVVFDWLTGNLYYVLHGIDYSSKTLNVFNMKLGNNFKKTLKIFPNDNYLPLNGGPHTVVIDPYRNALFFGRHEWINDKKTIIERNIINYADEQQSILNFAQNEFLFLLLGIDYSQGRLYRLRAQDVNTHVIYSNFDGSEEKNFYVKSVYDVKFIFIHLQWLYLGNSTSIWRVHKEKGEDYENAVKIIPRFQDDIYKEITGMKVISPLIQSKIKNNSCAANKGICEQFCFNGPKITCGCKDGESIQNDGRHCG